MTDGQQQEMLQAMHKHQADNKAMPLSAESMQLTTIVWPFHLWENTYRTEQKRKQKRRKK
mgnify:CR=1 FL=1